MGKGLVLYKSKYGATKKYAQMTAEEFGADNIVYHSFNHLDIEVYTDLKNPELEKQVEEVLRSYGLFYHKSEVWIEEEKLYEVLYELTV